MSIQENEDQEIETGGEVDLASIEDQELPGGDTDQKLESEEQDSLESDEANPSEEEDFAEVDFGSIELDSFQADARSETEEDKEVSKRNKKFAELRVANKRKEEELNRLKAEREAGFIESDPMPKRSEFVNDDVLYEKFNGNAEAARAAYEDALDDWKNRARERHIGAVQRLEQQIEQERQIMATEDAFEKSSQKYAKKVKNLDSNIEKAEKALMVRGRDGQTYDGSLLIKAQYGEDAPLILAAIGASEAVAKKVLFAQNPAEVHAILADIKYKARKALSSSKKKISRAGSETGLEGDAATPTSNLERAMKKAADKGDVKEYQRLKNLAKQKAAV